MNVERLLDEDKMEAAEREAMKNKMTIGAVKARVSDRITHYRIHQGSKSWLRDEDPDKIVKQEIEFLEDILGLLSR